MERAAVVSEAIQRAQQRKVLKDTYWFMVAESHYNYCMMQIAMQLDGSLASRNKADRLARQLREEREMTPFGILPLPDLDYGELLKKRFGQTGGFVVSLANLAPPPPPAVP